MTVTVIQKKIENVLLKLENNQLKISLNTFLAGTHLFGRNLIIGRIVDEGSMVAVVAVKKVPKFNFSLAIFLYIISFPTIIFLLFCFAKILSFDAKKWNLLYVFRIFIAARVFLCPHQVLPPKAVVAEKIIFLLLAILSILYSNIFFATLQDMNIVYDEVNYNSFQDLIDSEMKIHTLFFGNNHDAIEVRNFLNNGTKIDSYDECVKQLVKIRSIICVMSVIRGKYYTSINLDDQGRQIIKIADQSFHFQYMQLLDMKKLQFSLKNLMN